MKKGIIIIFKCQCCTSVETISHVLLHNIEIAKVWKWCSTPFNILVSNSHSLQARYMALINSIDFVEKGHIRAILSMVISWFAWKSKNEAKYDNKPIVSNSIIPRIMNIFKMGHFSVPMIKKQWKGDLNVANLRNLNRSSPRVKPLILVYWHKSIAVWFKLNTDASISSNGTAIGIVIRNSDGKFVAAYQKFLYVMGVFASEHCAIVEVLKLVIAKDIEHFVVESDALAVISIIKGKKVDVY